MTIVVAAASPDGIILGSDSRTTVLRGRRYRIASDSARKLFAPCNGIGIATFGSAMLGDRTIAGLMEEFFAQRAIGSGTLIKSVSDDLAEFFNEALAEHTEEGLVVPPGVLGFLVAGYDAEGVGRLVEVLLPPSEKRTAVEERDITTRAPGVMFRGRTRHVRRLIEGYDQTALLDSGARLTKPMQTQLGRMGYRLNTPISMQDALDLVAFIVRLTVDMERLTDGTYLRPGDIPACGGLLQTMAITRTSTNWVAEPTLAVRAGGMAESS